MQTVTEPPPILGLPMGKKKSADKNTKQVNVRFTEDTYARIEAAARTLGYDVAQLIRGFVMKQLPHAEREAAEIRRAERPDQD